MLLVILASLIATLIVVYIVSRCRGDDIWENAAYGFLLGVPAVLTGVVLIIICFVLCPTVVNGPTIQHKIEMYEEENTELEERIDDIVKTYLIYETDTYEKFKNESSEVLIQLFPDLKANQLLAQQMTIVQENRNQIKRLKEELISIQTARWWLLLSYE